MVKGLKQFKFVIVRLEYVLVLPSRQLSKKGNAGLMAVDSSKRTI
jgi:hypothetical protein